MWNSNSGYVGQSMSVRAQEAYDDGKKPFNKWTKSDIIDEIKDNYDLTKEEVDILKKYKLNELKGLLSYSEWHHTGKYYNETEFWELNLDDYNNFGELKGELDKIKQENYVSQEDKILQKAEKIEKNRKIQYGVMEYKYFTESKNHPQVNIDTRDVFIYKNYAYDVNNLCFEDGTSKKKIDGNYISFSKTKNKVPTKYSKNLTVFKKTHNIKRITNQEKQLLQQAQDIKNNIENQQKEEQKTIDKYYDILIDSTNNDGVESWKEYFRLNNEYCYDKYLELINKDLDLKKCIHNYNEEEWKKFCKEHVYNTQQDLVIEEAHKLTSSSDIFCKYYLNKNNNGNIVYFNDELLCFDESKENIISLSSFSGNVYPTGNKPSNYDYGNLSEFHNKGEIRFSLNDNNGYDLQMWNGKEWSEPFYSKEIENTTYWLNLPETVKLDIKNKNSVKNNVEETNQEKKKTKKMKR